MFSSVCCQSIIIFFSGCAPSQSGNQNQQNNHYHADHTHLTSFVEVVHLLMFLISCEMCGNGAEHKCCVWYLASSHEHSRCITFSFTKRNTVYIHLLNPTLIAAAFDETYNVYISLKVVMFDQCSNFVFLCAIITSCSSIKQLLLLYYYWPFSCALYGFCFNLTCYLTLFPFS